MSRPSRNKRSIFLLIINSALLVLCVYLFLSLLVMNNARTLMAASLPMTQKALSVLLTPSSGLWYYAFPSFLPGPHAARRGTLGGRADLANASRQLSEAQRDRLRNDIRSAQGAFDQLAVDGRLREAAIALAPGIAAASRLDDLSTLEFLIEQQERALNEGQ